MSKMCAQEADDKENVGEGLVTDETCLSWWKPRKLTGMYFLIEMFAYYSLKVEIIALGFRGEGSYGSVCDMVYLNYSHPPK